MIDGEIADVRLPPPPPLHFYYIDMDSVEQ